MGILTSDMKRVVEHRLAGDARRRDGHWKIAHMHNSVPFAMDGSRLALLDLTP
jgi:hypothetical protein